MNSRRDNLHTVYMFVVRNWAPFAKDVVKHTDLSKDQVASLLNTLENKGLVVSELVNGEAPKVWQSYHDIDNEDGAAEAAEADFLNAFPNEVKEGKTPKQVAKHTPDNGEVIYEVKRTRTTGAHVTLTNIVKDNGKRAYMTVCLTHGPAHEFSRRLHAEHMCHHPEDWCPDCQTEDTTNQHEQAARDLA
jgi:hypothetical protein